MKRNSWQEYQKEVADDRYYYLRSCIRQNFFPGSEKAFVRILRQELGLQMHQVDVEPLLNKMGVEYDPAAKYLLPNGKYIGRPEPAMVNLGAD